VKQRRDWTASGKTPSRNFLTAGDGRP